MVNRVESSRVQLSWESSQAMIVFRYKDTTLKYVDSLFYANIVYNLSANLCTRLQEI